LSQSPFRAQSPAVKTINVSVACGTGVALSAVVAGSAATNNWSFVWSGHDNRRLLCPCGKTVDVTAECANNPACRETAQLPIECPPDGPYSYDCMMTYKRLFCIRLCSSSLVSLWRWQLFLSRSTRIVLLWPSIPPSLQLSITRHWLLATRNSRSGFCKLPTVPDNASFFCGWGWRLIWRVSFAPALS